MRILFGFLIALTTVITTASTSAEARSLEEIKKTGVIRVAVDGATPAFNFYRGKELVGFEIDLANEIAKDMKLKIEWKVQPFNSLLVAISHDQFDLIATSHSVTPARSRVVDFIDPHYCTGAIIVSKPNGPKTAAELAGKVVVVPVGTVYYDQLKTLPGIKEVRTVPNETDGLQSLLAGRSDAWVTEQFIAFEAVKNHKDAGIQTGEVILKQVNAMVVSKGNQSLQKKVNQSLKRILTDGTYAKLSQKYFGKDIRCQ